MSVKIPLLADLIPEGIPYGSTFVIEFDPDSNYYRVLESAVHECLSAGHVVTFFDYTRFPDHLRRSLKALGSDVETLESKGRFYLHDGYSITLGTKSKEPFFFTSLKVSDVSLHFLKLTKENPIRNDVGFADNGSIVLRYNDEKSFVEVYATRVIPRAKMHDRISIAGFVNGVHSGYFYRSMEDLVDGIIDVRFDDSGSAPYTKLRVRSFKLGEFDGSWQRVKFEGPQAKLGKEMT